MTDAKQIGLFVTCLVDLMRPTIGFAAAKLIERCGYRVVVPRQGCCGQPNFNSGDRRGARAFVTATAHAFERVEQVVVPSGSCAAMLALHAPGLFDESDERRHAVSKFASKVTELATFLDRHAKTHGVLERALKVTYHDSCSGLRELGIKQQPRRLLANIGVRVVEMQEPEACCGFGGTFCVKYPDISNRIVEEKVENIERAGVGTVIGGDLGCLMNIEGRLHRQCSAIKVKHFAEVLVDDCLDPAL